MISALTTMSPGWLRPLAEYFMDLSLLLLGPFQVTLSGTAIPSSRAKKIEALLAYLAIEARYPHRRERLVGLLFPELPDDQARTNLRQTIKRLREAIGDDPDHPYLLITRESLHFNLESDHYLDTAIFEKLLTGCSIHHGWRDALCPECMALAGKAVDLYRGPFLDGFFLEESTAFEEWLLGYREHYQQETISVLQQLADFHESRGEYDLAGSYARKQIAMEPWREEAHRQLMRVLAYQGQRTAALHQYELLREQLWEELAVDPVAETDTLQRTIAASTETRPQNLPARDQFFVGREAEIAQIREILVDPDRRLLTLVGSGGSGKTALAVEAGWRVASQYLGPYLHGVFFVPLANISREQIGRQGKLNPLVTAVAEAVTFSFAGSQDPQAQLFGYLRERALLLVLDNVEHLLEAGQSFIRALLNQTVRPQLLITSRSRLNLRDEWLLEVGGLPYPHDEASPDDESEEALALFSQRARRLVPEFTPAGDSGGTLPCTRAEVTHICRLLQGIPLGIELAASWVRFLDCREIAKEIENSLDFLQSASPDIPHRQQSLRAVFDYSWALLGQEQQRVLACLSVFAGSFDRQAAMAVSQATLPQLATLVDHSLLQHKERLGARTHRYELLEVLRQYSVEKLASASHFSEQDVGDSHARYYLGLLKDQKKALEGRGQQQALVDISLEMPNIRKAWRWAAEYQKVTSLAQALDTLALFYYMNSLFAEGADNFGLAADSLVTIRDDPQIELLWGRLRTQQGWFSFLHGRQLMGRDQVTESVETLRRFERSTELALALGYLAVITYTLGDYEQAGEFATEGLAISVETQDATSIGVANNILSQLNYRMGLYEPARWYGEQSLAIARQIENPWSTGFALINLGRVAYGTGAYREAEALFEEALANRQAIGDVRGLALCRLYLGDAAVAQGSLAAGQQLWLDSLHFFEEIGNLERMSSALTRLGRVAAEHGQQEKARDQFLEALRLADKAQAIPRVLDALTGLATLLAGDSSQRIFTIAEVVSHHPAATQECRTQAARLLANRPERENDESSPWSSESDLAKELARLVNTFLSEA